ncbi:c-type cytochrome [Psychrobacter urativorans]|uniref:Cytochrome C oxidase Cbb3 n=1 Tax=Psychrobacter urativorans TaxID=45610 RepID=A0A0M5MKR0_9GAMM|nr:cytochrome c [Psychrobacter urativorans]ALF58962.1 cytochrome C oxidase Cbb3 [Psychrobacter urativorans]
MNYSKYPILTIIASMSLGMAVLSGCSSTDKNAPTIAEPADTAANTKNADIVDGYNVQSSRNDGAWGGVYMSREELAEPRGNLLNVSALPTIANDPELKEWHTMFGDEDSFNTNDGKRLYHESCAACHMHKGEGAIGAGYYPPLANNSKMESKYYIIDILINGFRGMPSFHMMMDDEQMAAVTQYIRTDLNGYKDAVTAADVAQLRHAMPPGGDPSDD